jgi:hypothetical protein
MDEGDNAMETFSRRNIESSKAKSDQIINKSSRQFLKTAGVFREFVEGCPCLEFTS